MVDLKPEIKSIIAMRLGLAEEHLTSDLTMEDLGFDSLAAAEVIVAIEEKLNRPIDIAKVAEQLTPTTKLDQLITLVERAAQEP